MLEPGNVIAERYELEAQIGEGGMGAVWSARHLTLDAPVALKFIDCRGPKAQQMADRFVREAKVCAAVRHRNVVQIMDFGECDDGPYMVMELLEGRTLADEFRKKKPMPSERVVDIVGQCLAGLAAVHDRGIVHRDLKPQNIFLVKDADTFYPKLLDFGVSKALDSDGPKSALTTTEGVMAGTPNYMSPEQARGLTDIDARADVYSIGVIMYRALTAEQPYKAQNVGDLLIAKVTEDPPALFDSHPEFGRPLSDFVERAMSRDRDKRHRDAREMLVALRDTAMQIPDLAESSVVLRANLSKLSLPPPPAGESLSAGPPGDSPALGSEAPTRALNAVDTVPAMPTPRGLADWLEPDDGVNPSSTPAAWESEPSEAPARKRRTLGALSAAAAIAVAGGLWLSRDAGSTPSTPQPPKAAAPAPAEPAAQPAAEPAPVPEKTEVQVTLSGLPEGAMITLDGQAVQGPVLSLPRDHKPHRIEVSADGHAPLSLMHRASEDGEYPVALTALPAPVAPRARPAIKPRPRPKPKPKPKPKQPAIVEELDF